MSLAHSHGLETIGVFESTEEEGAKGKGRGMERAGDVLYLELAAGPRDRRRRGPTEERVPSGSCLLYTSDAADERK